MITSISHKLAVSLSKHSEKNNEVDYLRYGIEILLGGLIKVIVLFTTAYLLGLLQAMIWVFSTFVVFRSLTGGHHYSTYKRCLMAGLVIMISTSYIAKAGDLLPSQVMLVILSLAALFGAFLTYRYAPSNHFYKKCTERQKKILRKYAFFAILLWFLLMNLLIWFDFSLELIFASILGFLFQTCSMHPYTYKMVDRIENIWDRSI